MEPSFPLPQPWVHVDYRGDLGPYARDGATPSDEATDFLTMSDTELVTTLQQALRNVRLFNLMDDDE